MFDEIT